jgi:hypothetical protein
MTQTRQQSDFMSNAGYLKSGIPVMVDKMFLRNRLRHYITTIYLFRFKCFWCGGSSRLSSPNRTVNSGTFFVRCALYKSAGYGQRSEDREAKEIPSFKGKVEIVGRYNPSTLISRATLRCSFGGKGNDRIYFVLPRKASALTLIPDARVSDKWCHLLGK